jgi:glycosyltransferase involved in cell wall biosynthesis
VISLRGGDVPGFLPDNLKFQHFFTKPLIKSLWRSASSVVANSRGLAALAQKTADLSGIKIGYIPNGVDPNVFKSGIKSEKGKVELLFVGRLVEQKRINLLFQAFKNIIAGGCVDWHCTIVGDGPLKTSLLMLMAELELERYLSFVGWVKKESMPVCYQGADIFVLPSSEEGMPNVVLEAMASGLPIICADIYGNTELVENGKNGLLFSDEKSLSVNIIRLIRDAGLRQKMGLRSLQKIEQFQWSAVAKSYVELLSQAMYGYNR